MVDLDVFENPGLCGRVECICYLSMILLRFYCLCSWIGNYNFTKEGKHGK